MRLVSVALFRLSVEGFYLKLMLIVISFPIADSRAFLDLETGRLNRPLWPDPIADEEFIRSFGVIKQRWRGGLSGWIGENKVCEAHQAFHFNGLQPYRDTESRLRIPFRVAYRRFYFDGRAVGKFEIALVTPNLSKRYKGRISNRHIKELFQHFLSLPLIISDPMGEHQELKLYQAGKYLAKLYASSSSDTFLIEHKCIQKWWVQGCKPILFLEQWRNLENDLKIPFWGKIVPLRNEMDFKLFHHIIRHNEVNLRLWRIHESPIMTERKSGILRKRSVYERSEVINKIELSNKRSRELRIFLLRLHAERECLKRILANIAEKKIEVSPRSRSSDALQDYLNSATRVISRLQTKSDTDSERIAQYAEDFISPGERDAIMQALQKFDIRRNVYHKVENFVNQIVFQENIMGDKYNVVGQVGAVGPHSLANNVTFNQIWNKLKGSIDLSKLADQLSMLQLKMLQESSKSEHNIAISNITKAEQAAKSGDGAKVIEHLKSAGKWALKIASKIGADIAAEVIKVAMGLK